MSRTMKFSDAPARVAPYSGGDYHGSPVRLVVTRAA